VSDQQFILAPPTVKVDFQLLPVDGVSNSLMIMRQAHELSGLGDWVVQTWDALSDDRRRKHLMVFDVLYAGVEYEYNPPDYPSYLAFIKEQDPDVTLKRILDRLQGKCEYYDIQITKDELLSSEDRFVELIQQSIGKHYQQKGLELYDQPYRDAFPLLRDPQAAHNAIVEHLEYMWDTHMRDEWNRNLPMLEECIAAFKQQDYSGMTALEAVRSVTGRDLSVHFPALSNAEKLVFVPSAHIGPYNSYYTAADKVYVFFGARMPEGLRSTSPALGRSELLVHINALADDTRLKILKLLTHNEELCAQDIINLLDLSQSSASRHLRQLTATGYLVERRRDVAKCYSLNMKRIDDTAAALKTFIRG